MQMNEIRNRFSQVEQCIDHAAEACQMSRDMPDQLRNCLSQLEQESDHAKKVVDNAQNEESIRQCVDKLEMLGDRAMQTCRQSGNVDKQVENALRQAHDAISRLKHQLH